jgi:hypothetical protein
LQLPKEASIKPAQITYKNQQNAHKYVQNTDNMLHSPAECWRRHMNAKWTTIAVVIAAVAITAVASLAQEPTFPKQVTVIADNPAATLLLPYFEVDLSNTSGRTTVFSIDNDDATAVLAHVVVWSDLGVPVTNFNVYLTGFDVQAINLRDVLNGHLPQTASAGQDLSDTVSPKGRFSQDINFASCNGKLPPAGLTQPPGLTPAILQHELTGRPGLNGACYAVPHGDNIARGYVTVDTVNNCTDRFPDDSFGAYFSSDLTNQPLLSGEYFYIDPSHAVAAGGNLVSIAADATDPATSTPGQYTFYGRYVNWDATDHRQPLATNFAARFQAPATIKSVTNSTFDADSWLIVWRDPKVFQSHLFPIECGFAPDWYPLGQQNLTVFDEQEHAQSPFAAGPFAAATQRVEIGSGALPISFRSGWIMLNLNTDIRDAQNNPSANPAAVQGFVTVIDSLFPTSLVLHRAIQLDSGTNADSSESPGEP